MSLRTMARQLKHLFWGGGGGGGSNAGRTYCLSSKLIVVGLR